MSPKLCISSSCANVAAPNRERCTSCLTYARDHARKVFRAAAIASGRTLRSVACSNCREQGHYKTTCPTLVEVAA